MRRLIYFLIRRRLKIGLLEPFTFVGQKEHCFYFFEKCRLVKIRFYHDLPFYEESRISLKFILSDECKISRLNPKRR
jgi:hypothetical protein